MSTKNDPRISLLREYKLRFESLLAELRRSEFTEPTATVKEEAKQQFQARFAIWKYSVYLLLEELSYFYLNQVDFDTEDFMAIFGDIILDVVTPNNHLAYEGLGSESECLNALDQNAEFPFLRQAVVVVKQFNFEAGGGKNAYNRKLSIDCLDKREKHKVTKEETNRLFDYLSFSTKNTN